MALLHISPLFRFSKHYAMLRMKFGQVGSYTDLLRQGKKYFINATIIFSDPSVMISTALLESFNSIPSPGYNPVLCTACGYHFTTLLEIVRILLGVLRKSDGNDLQ